MMRGIGALLLATAWAGLSPGTASAQGGGGSAKVSYEVELSVLGSLLDPTCTAAGTDVLTGTLVGFEPTDPTKNNVYVGTMTRHTRITYCGVRRQPNGEDVNCSINITGDGIADVKLTLYAFGRGAYLQYLDRAGWEALLPPRPVGQVGSAVNGTCDPAEMAQLQNEYGTGQTAGSPSGQLLEVPGLPPSGYPFTFPPKPPVTIWTLKVLARRP